MGFRIWKSCLTEALNEHACGANKAEIKKSSCNSRIYEPLFIWELWFSLSRVVYEKEAQFKAVFSTRYEFLLNHSDLRMKLPTFFLYFTIS